MSFRIRLLGTVEVQRCGRSVALGPAKRRALLAALALQANQPVTLSALTEAIWAGTPPASAVANLRTYAAGLRRAIGARLLARPRGYLLRVNDDELDVDEFNRLAAAGRHSLSRGDTAAASAQLSTALSLWRGPAGDNLEAGTTLHTRLTALDQQRLDAFEDYIDAVMDMARPTHLAAQVHEHLSRHPLRERAWAQLMLLRYRGGDVESALAAYRDARDALRIHLGLDPGQALTDLHQAILSRDPALDARPRLPVPTGDAVALPSDGGWIPEGLRAFAAQARLSEDDVRMLSAIQVRGRPPRTPERWRYIYTAIRTSEAIDR